MAAPAGNKFWQNRTRHGSEKLFTTPELLWAAAEEYFEWVDNNPWVKNEAVKSGENVGQIIKVPTARPYTMTGLCIYLGVNSVYFNHFKSRLKPEEKEQDKDFAKIIADIEEVIYTQKFEGAAVGAFKENIIARDLGLKDKSETDLNHSGGVSLVFIDTEGCEPIKATDETINSKENTGIQ